MNWGVGTISVTPDDSTAIQDVKLEALPSELRNWFGADVVLMGDAGQVCTAKINQLHLVARMDGFSELVVDRDDPSAWMRAKQQRAEGIWQTARHTGQAVRLIGRIGNEKGDCKNARWVSLKSVKLPVVVIPGSADDSLRERASKEFAKLPEFAGLQKAFTQQAAKSQQNRWDEDSTATRQIEVIRYPKMATILVVTAKGGEYGTCDSQEFYGELTAIWKLDGEQWTILGSRAQYLPVESAADLNGDGLPELFFGPTSKAESDRVERGYLVSDGGRYERAMTVSFPYYGCGC